MTGIFTDDHDRVAKIEAAALIRAIEASNRSTAVLSKAIDRAFFDAVRMFRAQGLKEPHTYHAAIEALNQAVKPFNQAYRS